MIKLLADKNIPLQDCPLSEKIRLIPFNPSAGLPDSVGEFDALLVRTVSPINSTTLPERPKKLAFVGSATAGFDHVDQNWLDQQGIHFAYSPGCNARAVGEYVGVGLMIWSLKTRTDLASLTAGIIGAGNTGQAVAEILTKMGVPFQWHDPPREEREEDFSGASIDEILECDILTFHTPLTHLGPWPTRHWLNASKLAGRAFKLVINAARGGVIDDLALMRARQQGTVGNYILDVWENEPLFNDRVASGATIRTPHIAGYSVQAKRRASEMVLAELHRFFGLAWEPAGTPEPAGFSGQAEASEPAEGPLEASGTPAGGPRVSKSDLQPDLSKMLYHLNPVGEYERRFDSLIGQGPDKKSDNFQKIRAEFPLRHEHSYYRLDPEILKRYPELKSLGFTATPGRAPAEMHSRW